MAKVKDDLAVKTGSYTNAQGEEKGRYENIGKVIQNDNGFYMLLKRTFNAAGVPNPEDRDMVMVSMFEPREKPTTQAAPQSGGGSFDDQIPFVSHHKRSEYLA